jgi:hypothetical protein
VESELLERVEHERDAGGAVTHHEVRDQRADLALREGLVDEQVILAVGGIGDRVGQRPLDAVVEQDAADRRRHVVP